MDQDVWTDAELAAAVEAYLQMLRLEERDEPFNKAAIRRMLLAGPISGRTTTEQRMQNISYVFQTMGRPWIKGYKPLSRVGAQSRARIQTIIERFLAPDAAPLPARPPKFIDSPDRKLPPTGYWLFVCNRDFWDGEAWLALGETELLYKLSKHNQDEMQIGDLGVLRLNARSGTRRRAAMPAAVFALVEVTGLPAEQADPDSRAYRTPGEAAAVSWRVPLRIMADLSDRPVLATELPLSSDYDYLRRPLNTSSIPISRAVYAEIFGRSGVDAVAAVLERDAQDPVSIASLERTPETDPKRRERVSRYIERGKTGERVKALRGGRCQICEGLGREPVAFRKTDGTPFSEAHHVYPVSELRPGSLGMLNIMVLCPNHHREVHLGDFHVLEYGDDAWRVRLGPAELTIPKTRDPSLAS